MADFLRTKHETCCLEVKMDQDGKAMSGKRQTALGKIKAGKKTPSCKGTLSSPRPPQKKLRISREETEKQKQEANLQHV